TSVGDLGLSTGREGMERAILEAGLRAQLGRTAGECDASPDPFEAMRFTLATHPELSATDVLHHATQGNAKWIGMGREVGSLEPGKAGDLVVLDLRGHRGFAHPDASLADRLVQYGGRWSIRWVIVDGEVLVEDGRMPHLDLETVSVKADGAAKALFASSGEGTRS
ncbi:MAG TPA: amidohydrolase family protein, partial [Candidatus Eisenbacteria bacterium]|nr:amidohydrolase family protein [Candidatus Eisenbacteria bacterium]